VKARRGIAAASPITVGVIGGSGLYDMEGLEDPSDA
jgi:purine nucleoside phosphorylase